MEAHTPHQDGFHYEDTTSGIPTEWHTSDLNYWRILERGREEVEANKSEVNWFRELYAAAISYLDRVIESFVHQLRSASERDVVVVITADHGENLGYESENYQFEHTASLSEALLHIPFVVINAPASLSPEEPPEMWSHLELPTMLSGLATGDEEVQPSRQRYLPAEIVGSQFGANGPEGEYWRRAIRCVYDSRLDSKYVWDSLDNRDRYKTDVDRPSWQELSESNLEADAIPERVSTLFDEDIKSYKSRVSEATGINSKTLSKSTQDRLERLGYL